MQTELTRLKADVRQLGTARDTVALRQRVAAANARLKVSAQLIGEQLKSLAVQNKSLQIQKIIGNFQVWSGGQSVVVGGQSVARRSECGCQRSECGPEMPARASKGAGAGTST